MEKTTTEKWETDAERHVWRTSFDVSHKIASSSRDFDRVKKKKKKKKLIFLSYKTKFNIRRGTLSLLLLFFSLSFAIVSFPLGFLYLSSLCYSHSPSVTSNLKLFFLFLSLYLPLSSFWILNNHDNSEKLFSSLCPLFYEVFLNIHYYFVLCKFMKLVQFERSSFLHCMVTGSQKGVFNSELKQ